ncbi:alpha/beta hydrolase [Enterococcus gilvus]|uniref:alpha/beta hydrolase n=1 Tax=Enterococcus gilvus TaxID=160453 RepID=UPI0028D83EB7|nr:alpha/beta hydrolase [Enterococcus gilvus]
MTVFTGNKQFDFQIDRFTSSFLNNSYVLQDRENIGLCIKDFRTWFDWWSKKANEYENLEEFKIACSYYKAAMFYLKKEDPKKQIMYTSFIRTFYKSYHDFSFERHEVPYEGAELPTLLLKNPNAKKTLLVIGGFDGYLEEIATFFKYMKGTNYNILIFDGPGQGNTPSRGLTFIPNFEKPVSKILDYFSLNEVDALGLSFGGGLVLRTAAFEKRVKRVITMDIFYSPMDTIKMSIGCMKYYLLLVLLKLEADNFINREINKIASKDVDMMWKLNNGYQLTGEENPFDLLNNLKRHNVKSILKLINQDCLLLAGKEDQYVPYKRLFKIKKGLVNSKKIEIKLFTKETGGEQHCQIGRMDLAFNEILKFLIC